MMWQSILKIGYTAEGEGQPTATHVTIQWVLKDKEIKSKIVMFVDSMMNKGIGRDGIINGLIDFLSELMALSSSYMGELIDDVPMGSLSDVNWEEVVEAIEPEHGWLNLPTGGW